jgi:hypothetical protein
MKNVIKILGIGAAVLFIMMTITPTCTAIHDTDGDGLSDWYELHKSHTYPNDADTDGDGVDDGQELEDETDPRDPSDHMRIPTSEEIEEMLDWLYDMFWWIY